MDVADCKNSKKYWDWYSHTSQKQYWYRQYFFAKVVLLVWTPVFTSVVNIPVSATAAV